MAHNRELSQFANVVGYDGGNIGIGTDNPTERLHLISGSTSSAGTQVDIMRLVASDFSPINSGGLTIGAVWHNTDVSRRISYLQSSQNLNSGSTNRALCLNPNGGNIGIGIDDPTSLIHGQVSSGSAILTLKSTATSGEASVSLSGKNSSGTVRTGIFKYDNADMFRIGTTAGIPIRFETNDTERLRITSDGKVSISSDGTADGLLTIKGDSNEVTAPSIRLLDGSDSREVSISNSAGDFVASTHGTDDAIHGRIKIFESGIIDLDTGGASDSVTNRLRITSAGKVQVTGTRGGTLQPSDDDTLELYTKATSGNASTGGGITFYNHHGGGHVMGGVIHVVKANGTYENSSSNMLFGTRVNGSSVAYRARLTSAGEWQTFSTSINIDISNTQSAGNNEAFIYARNGSTSMTAGTLAFRVYTNGNVSNTNGSYGSISDQNLKENIVDATSQWDDIKALQVRKYNFREATGHQTHTQIGLIAQEVETVSPGLVETTAVREGETVLDADGNQLESIKSIQYSVLYMKSVKALQEAQTRIETLESQHADLLARVTALEGS